MLWFDHINIYGDNLEELANYYQNYFSVNRISDGFEKFHGCTLEKGNKIVFLKKDKNYYSEVTIELVYKTDDIKRTYQELKRKNSLIKPPYNTDRGLEIKTYDPEKNAIIILEESSIKYNGNAFNKARNFIYRNARPLDLARWKFHFENGSAEEVLNVLTMYQNKDGGFAYALEPDNWNENSTPIRVWAATRRLCEIGFTDSSQHIYNKRYFEIS